MAHLPLFERAPATTLTSAGASGARGAGPDRAEIEARVTAMLPLVRHVVTDVAVRVPRFVDRDELISAGLLGLTQAAHSYDAARGVSFQAFARLRIKGAVLDELRGRDPLSRGARRRANQVNAATAGLQEALGRTPTDAETAEHLGVDVGTVRQAHDDAARAVQLERSTGDVDSSDVTERADGGEGGPLAELLDAELRGYLMDAVVVLPERLRTIVVAHFFDGREMQDIAAELGVTASRVSQLCGRAVALLRDGLNAQLDPERVEDLAETTSRVGRRKHAYYELVASCSSTSDRLARGRAHPSAAPVPARVAAPVPARVAPPAAGVGAPVAA